MAVRVRDPAFGALLEELLRQWGYAPSERANLLVEEEVAGEGVRILSGGVAGGDRLPIPLAMEELWVALGAHFHSPPRRYIRLPLRYPVEVRARGRVADSQLTSLSEMGGRFHSDRELAIGEEVALQVAAAGSDFLLTGKVIYVMGRQEVGGAGAPFEIGAVFDRTDRQARHRLRDLIIAAYLVRIRSRLDLAVFAAGLTSFRTPECGLAENFA